MEQGQQDKEVSITIRDSQSASYTHYEVSQDDDSIQLQSPEVIALNGLLNNIEAFAESYQSMADSHWSNHKGEGPVLGYTREQSLTAFGIYSNKAQDMRTLVNRWKPNKK